jgi:hypothetical protein
MKFLYSFLIAIFIISCKKNQNDVFKKREVLKIEKIAEFGFRKSYADHQYLNHKQLDSLYKTNPILSNYKESDKKEITFTNLQKLKIINGNYLVESLFDKDNLKSEKYLDKEKIQFSYSSNFTESNSINLIIKKNKKKTEQKVEFHTENFVGILLVDLDNDKIKEIMILTKYYIMNGDNYNLIIMKLKE